MSFLGHTQEKLKWWNKVSNHTNLFVFEKVTDLSCGVHQGHIKPNKIVMNVQDKEARTEGKKKERIQLGYRQACTSNNHNQIQKGGREGGGVDSWRCSTNAMQIFVV